MARANFLEILKQRPVRRVLGTTQALHFPSVDAHMASMAMSQKHSPSGGRYCEAAWANDRENYAACKAARRQESA